MNFLKAFVKFVPVFVLAGLMISGQDALIAAAIAAIAAIIVARIVCGFKLQECIDSAMSSVSNILIALFILMFAYAMASLFMSTGVGAAVVNIALKAGITGKSVAFIGILCTAVLSVATGSSWGTFAACAPIFLWLNEIVGGNLYLTVCAIAGGACFGDNIGLISDTTIVSSGIQGVQVVDRIRHQGVWSLSCLILAAIAFYVAASVMGLHGTGDASTVMDNITPEIYAFLEEERPAAIDLLNQVADGVALYMVIPLILVIVLAVLGVNTFACIGSGIVSSYILGIFAGTACGVQEFLDNFLFTGIEDAGAWVIPMMMWVAAFGGVMQLMDAFAPLANLIAKLSKKVRHLLGWNAVLSLLGNAALADEMAQIVTIGPVIKQVTEDNVVCANKEAEYKLKLRNATFGDAMGVFGSQLIPWHVYLGFYIGIASGVYPLVQLTNLDFIKFNFMAMIAVFSLLILTFTGLDRFVPFFKMPTEPEVQLKKNIEKNKAA